MVSSTEMRPCWQHMTNVIAYTLVIASYNKRHYDLTSSWLNSGDWLKSCLRTEDVVLATHALATGSCISLFAEKADHLCQLQSNQAHMLRINFPHRTHHLSNFCEDSRPTSRMKTVDPPPRLLEGHLHSTNLSKVGLKAHLLKILLPTQTNISSFQCELLTCGWLDQ